MFPAVELINMIKTRHDLPVLNIKRSTSLIPKEQGFAPTCSIVFVFSFNVDCNRTTLTRAFRILGAKYMFCCLLGELSWGIFSHFRHKRGGAG